MTNRPPKKLIEVLETRTTGTGDLSVGGPNTTIQNRSLFDSKQRPSAARAALWATIEKTYRQQQPGIAKDGNAAILMAGPPGVGKSTVILQSAPAGSLVIDPDPIKETLLKYDLKTGTYSRLLNTAHLPRQPVTPAELAALVHVESVLIAQALLTESLEQGENVVVCGTLSWQPYALDLLKQVEESGYESLMILDVEASKRIVAKRALERWWRGRMEFINGSNGMGERYIPTALIDQMFPNGPSRWSVSARNARLLYQEAVSHNLFAPGELTYRLVEASGAAPVTPVTLANTAATTARPSAGSSRCRRCHRPLTAKHSRTIGLGPSCAGKLR